MYISNQFSELELFLLFNEKIIYGQNTYNCSLHDNNISFFLHKIKNSMFSTFRWSFVFTNDNCMLYYALLSIFPYLSTNDNLICRISNDHYSLLVNVVRTSDWLHNFPFHFLFYLSMFTRDVEKDIDLIYQFWTHGRSISSTNMQHLLHFRKRNVAFDCINHTYFFSKYDANLWYHILFECLSNNMNMLFALLFSSLFFLSFDNFNMHFKDRIIKRKRDAS